jgi:putative sigma-54 modulation protein
MNIQIIGEHLEITDAMHNYVKEKFHSLAIPEKLQNVEFRFGTEKTEHIVQFKAHVANKDLHLKANASNAYTAIDLLMKKLHRSFTEIKDKKHIHVRKNV